MVLHLYIAVDAVSWTEAINTRIEEWAPETVLGCLGYCTTSVDLPIAGASTQLVRYLENPCVVGPHHQGSVALVHCVRISSVSQDQIQEGHLPLTDPFDTGRDDGLFTRLLNEFLGNLCLTRGCNCVRHPEHLFEKAVH